MLLEVGTRRELDPPERGHESALVLTKFFKQRTGDVEMTELVVKSPYLTSALREVISSSPGINFTARNICIPDLPECLFHYRKELMSYGNSIQDSIAAEHLKLLLNHMWKVLESQVLTYASQMDAPGGSPGIIFELLWMAFRPGCLIYYQDAKPPRVLRFKYMMKEMHHDEHIGWRIKGDQIGYNGTDFGYTREQIQIGRYDGCRSLKLMKVFPLAYATNSLEISR